MVLDTQRRSIQAAIPISRSGPAILCRKRYRSCEVLKSVPELMVTNKFLLL